MSEFVHSSCEIHTNPTQTSALLYLRVESDVKKKKCSNYKIQPETKTDGSKSIYCTRPGFICSAAAAVVCDGRLLKQGRD